MIVDTLIVGAAGGTASVLTGGKFANGAITAAFANLWNKYRGRISQNVDKVREAIANAPSNLVGSDDWSYQSGVPYPLTEFPGVYGANSNKCSLFIYDVLSSVGITVPLIRSHGFGAPAAGDWGDPNVKISGWAVVKTPMRGDIAAITHASANATGHVGIVTGLGLHGNYTVSAGYSLINRSDWGFRYGQTPVFRRYVGN